MLGFALFDGDFEEVGVSVSSQEAGDRKFMRFWRVLSLKAFLTRVPDIPSCETVIRRKKPSC